MNENDPSNLNRANLLTLPALEKRSQSKTLNTSDNANERHAALSALTPEQHRTLLTYLRERLKSGVNHRGERMNRYKVVDRQISTWMKHDALDSKRLAGEEQHGRQTAVQENLPILAAHLEDLVAFYADTLSPIGHPFVSTDTSPEVLALVRRVTQDATSRNYYSEVAAACRPGLKYNISGVIVEWDVGALSTSSLSGIQSPGNHTFAVDPYNTFWDPTVMDPSNVATQAEWAAYVQPVNRFQLLRNGVEGNWFGVEKIATMANEPERIAMAQGEMVRLWADPARAVPTQDGTNSRSNAEEDHFEWGDFGLSIPADFAKSDLTTDSYERTVIYAWISPEQHGLLSSDDRVELIEKNLDPNTFLELWRFELINCESIVSARPQAPRARTLQSETAVIPVFMSYLIRDSLSRAQRSQMELVVPFQRLASSMYSIAMAGLRKNVWGKKGFDPSMFNRDDLESGGGVVGNVESKMPGRDVRSGLISLDSNTGADQAFGYVEQAMAMKNKLFPSQALPAQIAGLDRAVTNQVSTLVHSAQRGMRMSLRMIDSSVFMPARTEAVRNLQRYESLTTGDVSDEIIAKNLGSGVESLEAERITEALWRILMAIIQNQEAMQKFDVPAMLAYLGQVLRVDVDMKRFFRGDPATMAQPPTPGAEQEVQPQQAVAGQQME